MSDAYEKGLKGESLGIFAQLFQTKEDERDYERGDRDRLRNEHLADEIKARLDEEEDNSSTYEYSYSRVSTSGPSWLSKNWNFDIGTVGGWSKNFVALAVIDILCFFGGRSGLDMMLHSQQTSSGLLGIALCLICGAVGFCAYIATLIMIWPVLLVLVAIAALGLIAKLFS